MALNMVWGIAACAALGFSMLAMACASREAPEVAAFDQARSAMTVAYGAVCGEASSVTHRSPPESLFAARRSTSDLLEKLASQSNTSELDRLRLASVRSQLVRLDAAILVRSLRSDCDAALARYAPSAKVADPARSDLREKVASFRVLDDRLIAAERAYHDASNRLAEMLKRESLQASDPNQRL